MTTSEHLGRQRMEASTWQPTLPRLPKLSHVARVALGGRGVAFVVLVALLAGLALFARPAAGRPFDPHGAGFRWSAVEPGTGRDVPRDEWVNRALAL